jgi:hypothetical protein
MHYIWDMRTASNCTNVNYNNHIAANGPKLVNLDRQQHTTLYVDRTKRKLYYFDLDFLNA